MTDKSEQHNTTTTSSPSISKPTTTASSTPTSDYGDKSPKQTDDADPMVIPLTSRFLYVLAPHTAEVLAEHLKECIHSWNIDIRLSSITVDNCTTNDAMIDILRQEFPYGSLMLHGRFLHMRCCAHILNLIVQDGLSVTASDKRNHKFEQVAKQVVPECTKKLQLDCKTRWNSTYDMLMVALNYKEVFVVLSGRESLFKNLPLNEDWEKVEKICELLEVFNDITLVFSASKYPTANNYFPCICGLRIAMSNWLSSPCDYIRKMVLVMLEKYNKYWADVNGLMGVATILDPRFKLKLIRFYFEKNYDSFTVQAEIDRIEGLLHEFVDEYEYRNGKNQASKSKTKSVGFFSTKGKGTMLNEFAEFVEQNNTAISKKSDLDRWKSNWSLSQSTTSGDD
ncbi:zinc finger BED domain-containing protein RICESLEEPER 1-like [Hibiscus syriacus]|uniref:zinc finger BED domain-containing protein RICESLEEPER 1-like n=1 Tax=Hibiscus syriacus TaxID=106335 RepID=UPI00192358C6|nr:zinc finger BED domain-containing protein RICESLEEPER 1-like [Hibiscus syriacus]